jgi:hypothetical protein
MDALVSKKKRIVEEMKQVKQDERHNKRMCLQREDRRKISWHRAYRFCLVLFLLSDGDVRVLYCGWKAVQQRFPQLDASRYAGGEIVELIAEQFSQGEIPTETFDFLFAPVDNNDVDIWVCAFTFHAEWKLAINIADLLLHKGVAAQSEYIHQRYRRLLLHSDLEVPPNVIARAAQKFQKKKPGSYAKWLQRWREKWGFRYGRLKAHSLVLAEDLNRKAQFWSVFCESKM